MKHLESFGLTRREAYSAWWNERHATNDHVSLGPRFRWVMEQLPKAPASILEIGCQTGGFTLPLLRAGYPVTAVDLVAENLGIVRAKAMQEGLARRLKTVHSFVEDLDFEGKFDVVLLCEVLIHVADDRLALDNAFKAVKPGGRLIVTVPWYDLYQGTEISRYYNAESFHNVLKSVAPVGGKVEILRNADDTAHTLGAVLSR